MSTKQHSEDEVALEITVLSAQSLKKPSYCLLIGQRMRPYITLSTAHTDDQNRHQLPVIYRTHLDETGAHNPNLGDTITIPVGPKFLSPGIRDGSNDDDEVYKQGRAVRVRVMCKRLFGRPVEMGWCNLPADDVLDGLKPPSKRRRLSYSLRSPSHGCLGYGVVHVAVRLIGDDVDNRAARLRPAAPMPEPGWGRVAIGIPVGPDTLA